ncbi:MAG TPA: hypothetical protein VL461_11855 [Dictyobacter sp.]|jgi:hypothetical protein|nr:hypothetical protein [Dictyobacter sp.]
MDTSPTMKIPQPKPRRRKHPFLIGCGLLIVMLAACSILEFINVTDVSWQRFTPHNSSLPVNVYMDTATLQPLFQSTINQQLPSMTNTLISVLALPPAIATILQPTATITSITPTQQGLDTNLSLSLYQGDTQPIPMDLSVTFKVLDPTAIQVIAKSSNNSAIPFSGPITNLAVPFGQLTNVQVTPNCGKAALNIGLKIPVHIGQGQRAMQTLPSITLQAQNPQTNHILYDTLSAQANTLPTPAQSTASNVVITENSFSSFAQQMNGYLLTNNVQIQNLSSHIQQGQVNMKTNIVTLLGGKAVKLGQVTIALQPTVVNGNLVFRVKQTTISPLPFLNFAVNNYNAQIEQAINTNLATEFAGKFQVASVIAGNTSSVLSCTSGNNLLLTGNINTTTP